MTCCCDSDGKEVKYGEEYYIDSCNTCSCGAGCTEEENICDDPM